MHGKNETAFTKFLKISKVYFFEKKKGLFFKIKLGNLFTGSVVN